MLKRLRFLLNRLREKLWVRPLVMCVLSLFGALLAKGVELSPVAPHVPAVSGGSVEMLLVTLSGSMLVIATFAVGSMVSSLASASTTATPRAFSLVVSDDNSQNALSIFIGAYIFSLVSIVFLKNGFFAPAGVSTLLGLTVCTFGVVIVTFVRWVDGIARLGRLGTAIDKAVQTTECSIEQYRRSPRLGCRPATTDASLGRVVRTSRVGYVQRINVDSLQRIAERAGGRIAVDCLPGAFVTPDRALARFIGGDREASDDEAEAIEKAFVMGDQRTFDEDPRFGIIVLSEIAGRALSPAVNDPGTAIDILGAFVKLLVGWARLAGEDEEVCHHDRVEVPEVPVRDLFDDAFTSIARDGAASVEVAARLQKAMRSLASLGEPAMLEAARAHSRMALGRSERAMNQPEDLRVIRELASFSSSD